MTRGNFTARARAVGAELRAWRERAGIDGQELARMLSWSGAKVSNMECGRRGVSEVDAAMYLACCRAPGDDIHQILEFFHDRHEYFVEPHGNRLADELLSLITIETTANAIQSFELVVVPGLLQTEDYARALITQYGLTPARAIESKVRARKDRQALLRRHRPPKCIFFLHENALRLPVGTNAIMNDQLLHLVFASSRPHLTIRVVRVKAGPVPGMAGPFALMTYSQGRPIVCLEHDTTSMFLDGDEDVRIYREVLARLSTVALDEEQSRTWLATAASAHDRPRGTHDDVTRAEGPPLV
ncbi:MAG TPA: helix-turn-helix transcriptional regulator [Actinophytocola sp.]|uniref:helix-turn-helix domain-containing protein n=1 Tax=Actinophytocola sp. TaxID=1872138 RepID=UPI002DDCCA56|nr:helix-turn-helix transcriptional regulator [Actinophytocola sp.]HEV2780443.1 helix-turn-helix transcriptional regulator [Actinophytocola sp.]